MSSEIVDSRKEFSMKGKLVSALLAAWIAVASGAHAQSLNQEIAGLADRINKSLVAQGYKNAAALDFTDIQGRPTELGRFLSDQLVVELVMLGGTSVADRANIKSILAEHKLSEEGLVNPANAKKLGEFAGVDAILTGSLSETDTGWELLVKAISTQSAKIVAAGRLAFPKTSANQLSGNRSVSGGTALGGSADPGAALNGRPTYEEASVIATKDIGALRVVLKSVMAVTIADDRGRTKRAIRVSVDYISRETKHSIVVAMNATNQRGGDGYNIFRGPSGTFANCGLGVGVRSSIADSNGDLWIYSGATGIGIVGVGCVNGDGDPSQIVSALVMQDRLNGARLPMQAQYVYGSPTTVNPGQTVAATLTFVQNANGQTQVGNPEFIQLNTEIVVGIVTAGSTTAYSLHNLSFDRVNMPARSR
jgi:hypothetical protein